MKNMYLLMLLCFTLDTHAQQFYPEVASMPITGIEYLQLENPYIIKLRPDIFDYMPWVAESRMERTKAPNTKINYAGHQLTSLWSGKWEDTYEVNDSFVLDSQKRIQTVFEHTYANHNKTKAKHEFSYNTNNTVARIQYFETSHPDSNDYIRQRDEYIVYDIAGKRIKDSICHSGVQYTTVKHYTYSNSSRLSHITELNGVDTISKVIYGFMSTFDVANLITARLKYVYNITGDTVTLIEADSFKYFNDYLVSSRTSYRALFSNGKYSTGNNRYESYSYNQDNQLTYIISISSDTLIWHDSLMTEIKYTNNKAEVAYVVPYIEGGGWSYQSIYKLLFTFNTGFSENPVTSSEKVTCYPNPAASIVTIKSSSNESTLLFELYDPMGKRIATFSGIASTNTIDISQYPNGIYYLHTRNTSGVISNHKLIIAH